MSLRLEFTPCQNVPTKGHTVCIRRYCTPYSGGFTLSHKRLSLSWEYCFFVVVVATFTGEVTNEHTGPLLSARFLPFPSCVQGKQKPVAILLGLRLLV